MARASSRSARSWAARSADPVKVIAAARLCCDRPAGGSARKASCSRPTCRSRPARSALGHEEPSRCCPARARSSPRRRCPRDLLRRRLLAPVKPSEARSTVSIRSRLAGAEAPHRQHTNRAPAARRGNRHLGVRSCHRSTYPTTTSCPARGAQRSNRWERALNAA